MKVNGMRPDQLRATVDLEKRELVVERTRLERQSRSIEQRLSEVYGRLLELEHAARLLELET